MYLIFSVYGGFFRSEYTANYTEDELVLVSYYFLIYTQRIQFENSCTSYEDFIYQWEVLLNFQVYYLNF